MRRRWWSHAVALLCIVYLIALLVFHQHLDPFTGNDTPDAANGVVDQSSALRSLGNFSNPQPQAPRTLKLQLQQLEAGMTRLEQEISHVKSKLTQDIQDHYPRTSLPPSRILQRPPDLNSQEMVLNQLRQQPRFEVRSQRIKNVANNLRLQSGRVPYLRQQEARPVNFRVPQYGDSPVRHYRSKDNGGSSESRRLQDGGVSNYDLPQVGKVFSAHHSQDSGGGDSNHHESQKQSETVNHHRAKDRVEMFNRSYQQTYKIQNSNNIHRNQQNIEVHDEGHYPQDGGRPRSHGQDFFSDQAYIDAEGQGQRNRLRRQQERFYHQPLNRLPATHPEGLFLPSDHMLDVHVLGEETSVEEDFTNSSLVKIGDGIAVYAAYHDDREPTEPTVRLIIILSAPKPKRGVRCHFVINDLLSTVDAEQYELCENHKKKYLGFIYSCPVPGAVPSARYQLSLSVPDQPVETRVPVPVIDVSPAEIREGRVTEEGHQYKYNFSVCVSPLFGSVLAKRLVEFLELTHMLGFQQVFFYDFQLSSVIQRVLNYYQKKGFVSVMPWKLPASMSSTKIWYHGQLVTNNDCLYRSMPLSAYTAFHDIDEFVVPHHPTLRTLGELFPRVLPNDTCGYSFQSAFYDPGISTNDFPDDLMTVALTARPAMLSKIRTKVLVAPRRVFEVGIHHISKQFREHWAPRRYDSSRAILHHYRQCIHDYGMRCENWVKDTIIRDRYLPELKTRMQDVIRTLRL